jgi:hypothetical protein
MTRRLLILNLVIAFLAFPAFSRAQTDEEKDKTGTPAGEETAVEEEVEEEVEEAPGEKTGEAAEEEEKVEEEVVEEEEEEVKTEEEIEPLGVETKPPAPEIPPPGATLVQNDWVSLKFIGVFVQYFRFTYTGIGGDATDWDDDFETKRIRTILTGAFWEDRVSFLLQGDLTETALFNGPDENNSGFLLDARVNVFPFKGFGPEALGGLGIAFGRFIPDYTYYMPRNVGLLDFVEYPLVTSTFAVWRQIGAQLMFNHTYFEAAVGIFNGLRYQYDVYEDVDYSTQWVGPGYLGATLGKNGNLVDDNRAKDYLVKIKGKYPDLGIWAEAFAYIGMPEFYDQPTGDHSYGYAMTFGGEAGIDHRFTDMVKLKVIGGFLARRVDFPKDSTCDPATLAPCKAYTQTGFFGHVGVQIGRWVEPMIRIDWLNDRGQFLTAKKVAGLESGEKVWTLWPSVGLKFLLYGDHLQLTLVETFKHYANPHYDDVNDLTLQLILLI